MAGLVAAVGALAAAAVAAVGPARGESAVYSWPPATLPAESPELGWYAPLPLLNRVPERLLVKIPCALAPPLGEARRIRVVSTARRPRLAGALWVEHAQESLRVGVGGTEVSTVGWPGSCPLEIEVADGRLRVAGRVVELDTGALDDMPIVTGLFTDLDLTRGERPRVVVRTRDYATSQTAAQITAATSAVLLALVAFIALSGIRSPRPARQLVGRAWAARDGTDVVVVGGLLVWWILAPTLTDDGWIWIQYRVLAEQGVDSIYLNNWGSTFPVGYWLTWLGQWTFGSATDLVVIRLPSLAALLAGWVLCRLCFARAARNVHRSAHWALAGVFLTGAFAWLMTLRFEPILSLLAVLGLASMLAFARAPRVVPLIVAAVAALLAVTAHPVGLAASAPLVASLPAVLRWLRDEGRWAYLAVTSIALSCGALALVLFTVDADVGTRIDAVRLLGTEELHREPWWREYDRYLKFDQFGGETAVRRLSLALIVLPAAALLARRWRARGSASTLPAGSVAVALVLLAFVSSKWPWHFGALVGLGAVAAATEFARLSVLRDRRDEARALLAGGVLVSAVLWAWDADGESAKIDLQEAEWGWVFGIGDLPFWAFALVVPAALVAFAVLRLASVRRSRWLAQIARWALPAATLAVLLSTSALLAYDAAASPWTPARQNLNVLSGNGGCGLADRLTGDAAAVDALSRPGAPTLLTPAAGLFFPCASIPAIGGGVVQVPRYVVFESSLGAWPLYTDHGPFAAIPDLYGVTVAASAVGSVYALRVDDAIAGLARADADLIRAYSGS